MAFSSVFTCFTWGLEIEQTQSDVLGKRRRRSNIRRQRYTHIATNEPGVYMTAHTESY